MKLQIMRFAAVAALAALLFGPVTPASASFKSWQLPHGFNSPGPEWPHIPPFKLPFYNPWNENLINCIWRTPAVDPPAVNGSSCTFSLANFDATLEPQEPQVGGAMKKTIWAQFRAIRNGKVVIHTFGSPLNTTLAVYTGTELNALTPVVSNTDKAVAGLSTVQSLVSFNAQQGVNYRIQMGSTGQEEDLYATINTFPAGGGLSAWLAKAFGNSFQGRDFICVAPGSCIPRLAEPAFLVHNSMNIPLTVTTTQTFGAGVTVPAPFALAPGALKLVTVHFTDSFNTTTTRTIAGRFVFTGRQGTTIKAGMSVPGLVVVKPNTLPDVLRTVATNPLRAGRVNELQTIDVTVKNNGAVPAIGCHARSAFGSRMLTGWLRINPSTGAAIGTLNQPATIPAHGAIKLRVRLTSQEPRLGDPTFVTDVLIDCANTAPAPTSDLRGSLDVTTGILYELADVVATKLAPAGDVLQVPAAGGVFRLSAVNRGPKTQLTAQPVYVGYYADGPNTRFNTKVCRLTGPAGVCASSLAPSVSYNAAVNQVYYFKVVVTPPAVDPGVDPATRRVYLRFTEKAAPEPEAGIIGTQSVAVDKQ